MEGYEVKLAGDGISALDLAHGFLPDLVILDLGLPRLDGIDVAKTLRQSDDVPILVLTARDAVEARVEGLDAGADDYLIKPFEIEELMARIHALMRRSAGHSQLRLGALEIDRVGRQVLLAGKPLELTTRELALLLHLALRPDRVVTRSELLSQVWSVRFDPESNVVEVHISRLRDKLGKQSWMIETVRGRGYRLRTQRSRG
jgi:DNA-binding response OmpR family regulator